MKRFLYAGFESGIRFNSPASGYERRKETVSFTVKTSAKYGRVGNTSNSHSSAEAPSFLPTYSKAIMRLEAAMSNADKVLLTDVDVRQHDDLSSTGFNSGIIVFP